MKMVSTKLPKRKPENAPVLGAVDEPRYPYGLELRLEDEVLKRLGMPLPKVGTQMKIQAVGSVTSVRENKDRRHEKRSVEIQIEMIDVQPAKKRTAEDAVTDAIKDL